MHKEQSQLEKTSLRELAFALLVLSMEVLKKKSRDTKEMITKANINKKNYKRAKQMVENRLPDLNTNKGDMDGDINRILGQILGNKKFEKKETAIEIMSKNIGKQIRETGVLGAKQNKTIATVAVFAGMYC